MQKQKKPLFRRVFISFAGNTLGIPVNFLNIFFSVAIIFYIQAERHVIPISLY